MGACAANSVTKPDLSLSERFVLVALREADGSPSGELVKWQPPIRVQINGAQSYRSRVVEHLELLGELTGLTTEMDSSRANMIVEFSNRISQSWCVVTIRGRADSIRAEINIRTDQSDEEIGRCIVQEMTQALGLTSDLDGRTDTNFTSFGFAIRELTSTDRQLLKILYDDRLYDGMPRKDVLAVLPEIIADLEDAHL